MYTANPIPPHLAEFPWYAPHLAFLRTGGLTPRHDPGDALPRRADLRRADLFGVDLHGADLSRADLRGVDLTGANLHLASLRWAILVDADLSRADLSGAFLTDADLRVVNLTGANLGGTYLRWADLRWADLSGANLTCADLLSTVLSNAKLPDNVRAGHDGGYRWSAVAQANGVHLRYGCEWHPLEWWREQTPELSVEHGHGPGHWDIGPAVAIAAAEALAKLYPAGTP